MTQAEFNTHYLEYLHSYNEKYKFMDLNFDTIMLMKGVSKEEFDEKIKHVNAQQIRNTMVKDNVSENGDEDWIDGVDEGNRPSNRGKSQDYNVWIDEGDNGY